MTNTTLPLTIRAVALKITNIPNVLSSYLRAYKQHTEKVCHTLAQSPVLNLFYCQILIEPLEVQDETENFNVDESTLNFLVTSWTKLTYFLGRLKLFTAATKKLKIILEGK